MSKPSLKTVLSSTAAILLLVSCLSTLLIPQQQNSVFPAVYYYILPTPTFWPHAADVIATKRAEVQQQAADGSIAYSPERQMVVGTPYVVAASITLGSDIEAQTIIIERVQSAEGPDVFVTTEPIGVTWWMEAELSPVEADREYFKIALRGGEDSLRQIDDANWEWDVTPLIGGTRHLQLTIWPLDENGKRLNRRSEIKTITVEANYLYSVLSLGKGNWQWLLGTFVAAAGVLAAFIPLYRRGLLLVKPRTYKTRQKFQQALLSAYTEASLRQMVQFGLGQDLEEIAGGDTLTEVTFNLIMWAERHGQMDELVRAAYEGNPDNPELKAFAEEYFEEFSD